MNPGVEALRKLSDITKLAVRSHELATLISLWFTVTLLSGSGALTQSCNVWPAYTLGGNFCLLIDEKANFH